MWEIMKYMTDLPPLPINECVANVRSNKSIVKVLISQAKKYLEDR